MIAELKDALFRSQPTLAADAVGVLSLVAMFILALSLTNLS
ncbi:MAG: hypothetical protein U1E48_01285 [Paracoccaceae bacterium]